LVEPEWFWFFFSGGTRGLDAGDAGRFIFLLGFFLIACSVMPWLILGLVAMLSQNGSFFASCMRPTLFGDVEWPSMLLVAIACLIASPLGWLFVIIYDDSAPLREIRAHSAALKVCYYGTMLVSVVYLLVISMGVVYLLLKVLLVAALTGVWTVLVIAILSRGKLFLFGGLALLLAVPTVWVIWRCSLWVIPAVALFFSGSFFPAALNCDARRSLHVSPSEWKSDYRVLYRWHLRTCLLAVSFAAVQCLALFALLCYSLPSIF